MTRNDLETGIGETDWLFKTEFEVKEGDLQQPNVDLVSEGLDTYANVTLGVLIHGCSGGKRLSSRLYLHLRRSWVTLDLLQK